MAIFDDSFVGASSTTLNGFNDGPGAWSMLVGSVTSSCVIASSGAGIKIDSVVGGANSMFYQALGVSTVSGSSVAWIEGRVGSNVTSIGWDVGICTGQSNSQPNTGFSLGTETSIGFKVVENATPANFIFGGTTVAIGDYLAMELYIGTSSLVNVYLNGVLQKTSTLALTVSMSSTMTRASGFRVQQGAGHPILDPAWTRWRGDVGVYPGVPSSGGGGNAARIARAVRYYSM